MSSIIRHPKIYYDFLLYQKNLNALWNTLMKSLENQEKSILIEDLENLEFWIKREENAKESFLDLWKIYYSLFKDFLKLGYINQSEVKKFKTYWQKQKTHYLLKKDALLKILKELSKKISQDYLDLVKNTPFRLKAPFHSSPQTLELFI